ncbi:hypothetical protein Glove_271g45 [Diversispora epigaea]|uniref:BTB domain-containing protein n=1 Tax=Diversispora epigaea TaxID=1348612 RepID=A0A397I5L9_9GLOM|nr:hypothetical protein Glove_271g45 [Diversispora epigaea]
MSLSFKFFDKLSQNFIELLNDKDDYNVIVEVENEKSFPAHSNVLKCRSPYFRKELENIIPNENNIKKITKPNISGLIFDIILKYIYGGIVNFENFETRFIFNLMIAANEFEIEELTKKLENHFIENKSSWLKSHFSLVYRSIFSGNNFKDLQKFCNDIVANTVVITKVKGTEEILGGYNPLAWDANINSWGKTNDSFIFSLKNGNIQNSILSRVKTRDFAILNVHKNDQKYYGPYFGNSFYMYSSSSNFTLDNYSVCNSNGYYEKAIRTAATNNFSIVDYEVFKVIKKTN